MAAIQGGQAKIRFTSVLGTSSTDNAATRSTGAGSETGYVQIDSTARRHWDRSATAEPILADGGVPVSSTNYTVNPVQGKFQWVTGDPPVGTYTIDCHFLTNTYLTGGQSWGVSFDTSMYDTTSFATSTGTVLVRTFQSGLTEGTVTIDHLISTGDTGPVFYDRMNLENDLIIELKVNDTSAYEAYGYVNQITPAAGIDQVTAEGVQITLDGPLYYSTV